MSEATIFKAFADLPDPRQCSGQRHTQALCLSLFTLAIAAGNKGFLAIGDWLKLEFRLNESAQKIKLINLRSQKDTPEHEK